MANSGTTEFDVELCHAFISTIANSDLICRPCKQGLTQRYLHSKARTDLIWKVYRRISQLDRPLFERLMQDLGGPADLQLAIQDLNNNPHCSYPPGATGPKQWDCVDVKMWGNLHVWLRVLADEESVAPHPVALKDFKTSAWRSRVWAATAGRYTLDDLRAQRSMRRFLDDHEAHLLESCLLPADAKIPRLAKFEITPATCKCFQLGTDEDATFQDIIQTLSMTPEALSNPRYVHIHREAIIARLVGGCFDPEIVEGVFQRCVPAEVSQTSDPFEAFVEYWDSAPVRQTVKSLLVFAQEASPDTPPPPGVTKAGTEGPVDYEGEARKIRSLYAVDTDEWFESQF
ncbi:hypothetical protein KVR01_000942 [Diaporthe batatas]|uniref:uncharacterized protein n=1 Tax=Diaporthe batatas TaxID=748121 RepID=UPI001D040FE3|nr:uncharacterized protein KVR01_000942 [Diaporthe batatas]KAG8170197.1 hypothetical protein KVR01_000942 [Diaporthe batatas]